MENNILDGKLIAGKIQKDLEKKIKALKDEKGIVPGLATVIVGSDPSALSYVKNKEKVCIKMGINSFTYELDLDITEEKLVELIEELNARKDINGILVQLPLPRHINPDTIARAILPEKDVDGFNPENSGRLFRGEKCLIPCTAKAVIRILEESNIPVAGKKAAVVGRSNIVGKPAAMLLLDRNATVTICHSRTKNLKEELSGCDIVISAVGKPGVIKEDMIKEGAVVIDVGTSVVDGKLKGDVDFENVKNKASYITPVPGGVGSTTTTMLIENILEAMNIYE